MRLGSYREARLAFHHVAVVLLAALAVHIDWTLETKTLTARRALFFPSRRAGRAVVPSVRREMA